MRIKLNTGTVSLILALALLTALLPSFATPPAAHAQDLPYYYYLTNFNHASETCDRDSAELSSFNLKRNFPANSTLENPVLINGTQVVLGFDTPAAQINTTTSVGLGWSYGALPAGTAYTLTIEFRLNNPDGVEVSVSRITLECSASDTVTSVTVTNEAPGVITTPQTLGSLPGADMVFIPQTAVVGLVMETTPLFWSPSPMALSGFSLNAGKTVWVYGLDTSTHYYKVMLAGLFFWVDATDMGPNPDKTWNSRPLPTEIVQ
jgi:hypothetical protein